MSLSRYVLIICLCVIITLGLSLSLTQQHVSAVNIGPLNQLECETGSALSEQLSLQVYTPVAAHKITQTLCDSPLIQARYGSVMLSWQARETLSAVNLLNQDFDIVMGREHSLKGLLPSFSELYIPIIKFDGISVFWFSHRAIEFDRLTEHAIGLVEDTLSHTHYLLPLQDLKSRHINIDMLDIHYYPDSYSLYAAFDSGEVDMISTIESFRHGREEGLHSVRITDVNSATLFASHTLPGPIRCEVTSALTPMTEHLSVVLKLRSAVTNLSGCEL